MKQSTEERKLHHQTREDRQRKALDNLLRRVSEIEAGRGSRVHNQRLYEQDIARLRAKLNIA